MTNNDQEKFTMDFHNAKKGVNPDCKTCGGTGYSPYPNHDTTHPVCVDCESWCSKVLSTETRRFLNFK